MIRMDWIIFALVILAASVMVGLHLGRFREAYTEMTGMMAGMAMGMLNGFVLGYAIAAATQSQGLFWGNLFGILFGLALGIYFGRAGGLIGMMDGAMGGLMGGAMGAMLAAMLLYPPWALFWTAVLLTVIYVVTMLALVVLIERSAPEHAARHRLLPWFTQAEAIEVAEEAQRTQPTGDEPESVSKSRPARKVATPIHTSTTTASPAKAKQRTQP